MRCYSQIYTMNIGEEILEQFSITSASESDVTENPVSARP